MANAGAIVFAVLFGLLFIAHAVQFVRTRARQHIAFAVALALLFAAAVVLAAEQNSESRASIAVVVLWIIASAITAVTIVSMVRVWAMSMNSPLHERKQRFGSGTAWAIKIVVIVAHALALLLYLLAALAGVDARWLILPAILIILSSIVTFALAVYLYRAVDLGNKQGLGTRHKEIYVLLALSAIFFIPLFVLLFPENGYIVAGVFFLLIFIISLYAMPGIRTPLIDANGQPMQPVAGGTVPTNIAQHHPGAAHPVQVGAHHPGYAQPAQMPVTQVNV